METNFIDVLKDQRTVSPAPEDRFRLSISQSTVESPLMTTRDLDIMQVNLNPAETVGCGNPSAIYNQRPNLAGVSEAFHHQAFPINEIHRTSQAISTAPPWAEFGTICYSDIVNLEFRTFGIHHLLANVNEHVEIDTRRMTRTLSEFAVYVSSDELQQVAATWISNSPAATIVQSEPLFATFFSQTYCHRSTWQITKVLNCVLWDDISAMPSSLLTRTIPRIELEGFKSLVRDIQHESGLCLVLDAFETSNWLMSPGTGAQSWISFDEAGISRDFRGSYEYLIDIRQLPGCGDCYLDRNSTTITPRNIGVSSEYSTLFEERDSSQTPDPRSIILVRPSSEPVTRSKFAFFILSSRIGDDQNLAQWLREAMRGKHYHAKEDCIFTDEDWKNLKKWRKMLRRMRHY